MSVINKMLRDLDRRAAQAEPQGRPALLDGGVASVDITKSRLRPHREPGRRLWILAPAGGFVLLLLALVWFALAVRGRDNAAPAAAVPVAPTMASSVPVVAPVPLAENPVSAPLVTPSAGDLPQAAASGAQTASATDSVTKAASVVATSVPPIAPAAGPRRDAPGAALLTSRRVATSPASNPVGAAAAPLQIRMMAPVATPVAAAVAAPKPESPLATALPDVRSAAATWQDGARESLAQAQRLHAGGARDAAAELLREVLAGIERNHVGDDSAAGTSLVVALVRELVRIELLQEQYAAVLSTLRRHEGPAARQADLWAVRANAAQRLGQHAEASRSYQAALRLRPSEPRWMLGAAVSLAILGQTATAGELAEQARTLGGANPDVLAYLRQLGVTLRER